MFLVAEVMGSKKIILEVRVSNNIAYSLYEKLGFEEISIRRNYYRLPKGREDAFVMSKTLKKGLKSKFFLMLKLKLRYQILSYLALLTAHIY